MAYRLAKGVQVRKEDWGLLFYAQGEHKIYFVQSGDWLYPPYFDGTWTFDSLVCDIAKRMESSVKAFECSIQKLTMYLVERGIIVDELC